jgi:hypothetical protein
MVGIEISVRNEKGASSPHALNPLPGGNQLARIAIARAARWTRPGVELVDVREGA